MSECVTGYIDHIIFRNEDNGYTVMVLKGVKDEDELTCVGTFPVITQGASIEAEGSFIQHPVYGKQFQAVRLTEKMPEDAMAMERYLGSGAIKHWQAGSCGILDQIHFGLLKKSRSVLQKSRESVRKKHTRLQYRLQRNPKCEKL